MLINKHLESRFYSSDL